MVADYWILLIWKVKGISQTYLKITETDEIENKIYAFVFPTRLIHHQAGDILANDGKFSLIPQIFILVQILWKLFNIFMTSFTKLEKKFDESWDLHENDVNEIKIIMNLSKNFKQ